VKVDACFDTLGTLKSVSGRANDVDICLRERKQTALLTPTEGETPSFIFAETTNVDGIFEIIGD
jgi:hypothetical protein